MDAGVDMATPEPIMLAIDHFSQLVDQLIDVCEDLKMVDDTV